MDRPGEYLFADAAFTLNQNRDARFCSSRGNAYCASGAVSLSDQAVKAGADFRGLQAAHLSCKGTDFERVGDRYRQPLSSHGFDQKIGRPRLHRRHGVGDGAIGR